MKAIQELTNTEKARLLHELFPTELSHFLEHLKEVCSDLQEHKEEYKAHWKGGFMSFDYWFALSVETPGILKRHTHNMKKSSRIFSEQLFFTYTYLFVNDRIIKYADKVSENEKFKIAVDLFYK